MISLKAIQQLHLSYKTVINNVKTDAFSEARVFVKEKMKLIMKELTRDQRKEKLRRMIDYLKTTDNDV